MPNTLATVRLIHRMFLDTKSKHVNRTLTDMTKPHFSKGVLLSKSRLTANKHCSALILVKAQKDLIYSQEY
jgi:hypothetical protein